MIKNNKNTNFYNFYLIPLFLLLMMSSCKKDIIGDEGTTVISTADPIISVESSVIGTVTNNQGEALAGVSVTHRGELYTTDENGYFKFESTTAVINGGYLSFQKAGYFDNYKFYYPQEAGDQGFVRVIMQDLSLTKKITASEGGLISLASGASVYLKANSIIDSNGNTYIGEVSVYAYYYNPLGDQLAEEMPGDLRGTDAEGNRVQLGTYGMMAVELRNAAGEELNIADGQTATMTMPIPEALQSSAPEALPIWSYDEERGYWRQEEGKATVQGQNYVAEVPHFSFWNYDAPFPIITFCALFIDQNGQAISDAKVTIRISGTCVAKSGWTDARGKVGGDIPKGELLDIYIKDECGGLLYEDQIGPFEEDVNLGEIVVNLPEESNINVKGLLTCDGVPVTNGYALLTTNDGVRFFAPTDEDGQYSSTILLCGVSKISVQGFDLDTPSKGEVVITPNPPSPLVIDQEVCTDGTSPVEYITYNLDGEVLLIEDPSAEIINGCLIINGDNMDEAFISIEACNAAVGDLVTDRVFGNILQRTYSCNGAVGNSCDNFKLNIEELGGIGEFVIGNFEDLTVDPNIPTIIGDFRIYLDDIRDYSILGGQVWNDLNGDETFDMSTELISPNIPLSIDLYDKDDAFVATTKVDPELGMFVFTELDAGDYYVKAEAPLGFEFIPLSTDNVIDPVSKRSALIAINGEMLTAHIGIKESTTVDCDADLIRGENSCNSIPGLVRITVTSQDTLAVFVDDNTGSQIEAGFITGWNPYNFNGPADLGYQYRIEDADGNVVCSGTFDITVEGIAGVCELWPFYDCDNDIVVGGVEYECEGIDYNSQITYLWSNGSTDPLLFTDTEGIYTITATDGAGCTATGEVTIDFREYKSIFGFIWEDNPMFNDGVYDRNDELLVDGVTINLYEEFSTVPIQTAVTTAIGDFDGAYSFEGLADGRYFIEIMLPNGYSYIAKDVGNNEYTDSEVDPNTGFTDIIEIGGCETHSNINIGIKQ